MKKMLYLLCFSGLLLSTGCGNWWGGCGDMSKGKCGDMKKGPLCKKCGQRCECAAKGKKCMCPKIGENRKGGKMGKCGDMKGGDHMHDTKKISAEDAKARMESGADVVFINVLGADTFKDCSIKGSVNAKVGDDLAAYVAGWDKNREIILYCANYACMASRMAYTQLHKLGFTNLVAYEGGMKEWREKGFASLGECTASYLR